MRASRRACEPRTPRISPSLGALIGDELRFFKGIVSTRHRIGALSPSGRALARLMVQTARPDPAGYTLELGPGTGVFTQALIDAGISSERIVAVERSPDFCKLLRRRFPKLTLVEGDAFDLGTTLAELNGIRFSAALSGLPLLSFPKPMRVKCVEGVLDRMLPGKGLTQFSYGLAGPLPPIPGRITAQRSKWVILNLPPARVWTYSRPALP